MKTKNILIIALLIISFVCFADTNVKADNNDSWIYETTIDGTLTINYTVIGTFGEYSQLLMEMVIIGEMIKLFSKIQHHLMFL